MSTMAPLKATWHPIASSSALKRSSHTIFPTDTDLVVFSGELEPRKPVDNKIYHVPLTSTNPDTQGQVTVMSPSGAPSPRVGSAATVLDGKTYLFSGRGEEAMEPLEDNGRLWVFDQARLRWSSLEPADTGADVPEGRSYHTLTNDGEGKLYLHAGCPASGRLSDLWSFDLHERTWKRLPDAPGPARGGASLAFAAGKLWRMNGFDGKTEQGLALDIFDPTAGMWETRTWDAGAGPTPRSVCTLLPVKARLDGGVKEFLVTMFGESDPSNLGHMGAGKMLGDVWAYDLEGEGRWERVKCAVSDGENGPAPRGWFAADVVRGDDGRMNKVVVQGGLGADNERLGDAWVLKFE